MRDAAARTLMNDNLLFRVRHFVYEQTMEHGSIPAIDAVDGPIHLSGVAWVYLLMGDLERGLDLMEESQAHPNNHTIYDIQAISIYDVVRDHPRFIALIERLKGSR